MTANTLISADLFKEQFDCRMRWISSDSKLSPDATKELTDGTWLNLVKPGITDFSLARFAFGVKHLANNDKARNEVRSAVIETVRLASAFEVISSLC